MDKYSELDMIAFDVADMGIVEIRISKTRWDGEEKISHDYHRAAFNPHTDTDRHLLAINEDLVRFGFPEMNPIDVDHIRETVALRQTPERIARFEAVYGPKPEELELIPLGEPEPEN